jgi:hypothetical protein
VPALPSSILEPCGSRSPHSSPLVGSTIRSAATGPASPTSSSSTSSSSCSSSGAATAASPTTPARPQPCAAAATNGSPPEWPTSCACSCWPPMTSCPAWSWNTWPSTGAPQGTLRRPGCRAQPGGSPQAGLKRSMAVEASGSPLAALPAPANHHRRRPAGGDPGRHRCGRSAARPAGRAPGRRLRLPALPTGPDQAGMVGQIASRGDASSDPGGPPVGDRTDPCLGQPARQAALVHRAASAGRRVLAGTSQRRHRLWPAAPPRLDPLSLGRPPTPSPMTAYKSRYRALQTGRREHGPGPPRGFDRAGEIQCLHGRCRVSASLASKRHLQGAR